MSSIARYWSAVSFPPGSFSRIMNMYALPTPAFDAVLAGVAVLLLVAAVELDEALVRRRSRWSTAGSAISSASVPRRKRPSILVPLDRRELRLGRGFGRHRAIPVRNVEVTRIVGCCTRFDPNPEQPRLPAQDHSRK